MRLIPLKTLHIGEKKILSASEIIGFFPLDGPVTDELEAFLKKEEEKGRCLYGERTFAKTVFLTDQGLYYSKIAAATLLKRGKGRAT